MASKDTGKGARIGLACNACRSKKHRVSLTGLDSTLSSFHIALLAKRFPFGQCSGEKPQCAQCASTNVTCTWPAQLKRGPPKHYTNSLEARLFETEAVLLSLLSHISPEQLKASFQSTPSAGQAYNNPNYGAEPTTEQLALIKQDVFKPAYWNSFPLDSDENVRRWWEDRTSRTSAGHNRNEFAPNLASQERLELDTQSSGLPEPGYQTLENSALLTEHNGLDLTEPEIPTSFISLTQDSTGSYLHANVQSGTSRIRSEDELNATNPDNPENLLTRDGNRDSIMQISDQFKEDFLW
ncbi:hypothetical protein IQ07DRAFT_216388 [Pyrenochaeta sp. DS3sAY3a]|nr:hypothetical protein IQ07DRAFT_216388 [Pyrenochaeta sp. DS3sAY3a]